MDLQKGPSVAEGLLEKASSFTSFTKRLVTVPLVLAMSSPVVAQLQTKGGDYGRFLKIFDGVSTSQSAQPFVSLLDANFSTISFITPTQSQLGDTLTFDLHDLLSNPNAARLNVEVPKYNGGFRNPTYPATHGLNNEVKITGSDVFGSGPLFDNAPVPNDINKNVAITCQDTTTTIIIPNGQFSTSGGMLNTNTPIELWKNGILIAVFQTTDLIILNNTLQFSFYGEHNPTDTYTFNNVDDNTYQYSVGGVQTINFSNNLDTITVPTAIDNPNDPDFVDITFGHYSIGPITISIDGVDTTLDAGDSFTKTVPKQLTPTPKTIFFIYGGCTNVVNIPISALDPLPPVQVDTIQDPEGNTDTIKIKNYNLSRYYTIQKPDGSIDNTNPFDQNGEMLVGLKDTEQTFKIIVRDTTASNIVVTSQVTEVTVRKKPIIDNTNSIETPTLEMTVSPNPASDFINLRFNNREGFSGATISIINGMGKKVYEGVVTGYLVDGKNIYIGNLPSGFYLVVVETEDGTKDVKKFIKD